METNIQIREAGPQDAPLLAQVVAMGIGYDESKDYAGYDFLRALTDAAGMPDSQYSYSNALIAEIDGIPVGAAIGYDGGNLESLRKRTLEAIHRYNPDLRIVDNETEDGEFYLDSLAILPQYRSMGIGRKLIDATIKKARSLGHRRIGLLVDFENPDAERLYLSLGFSRVGTRPFFGHQMKHLQLPI